MKIFQIHFMTEERGRGIAVVSACDPSQALDTLMRYGALNYSSNAYQETVVKLLSPYSIFEVPKIVSEDYTGKVEAEKTEYLSELKDVDVEKACDGDVLVKKSGKWVSTSLQDLDISGDKNYVFKQSRASKDWFIYHRLGKIPSVTVVDSENVQIYGEVEYSSTDPNNILTIHFTSEVSGTATFN